MLKFELVVMDKIGLITHFRGLRLSALGTFTESASVELWVESRPYTIF